MTVTTAIDGNTWAANTLSVNTHLNWTNVPYTNLTNVFNALHYLGISNIRDDNSNLSIMNQVANAGFRQDLMVGSDQGITTVHNLEAAHPGAVRAIEGPNEVNGWGVTYNGQSGYAGAIAFQQHLYQTVNADSVLKNVDVFNTTVSGINDTSNLGNLSAYTDYGNVHDYYGTGYPWLATDPNYTWQKYHDAGNIDAPGKPVVVTETGVSTATVSETKQAATVLDAIMDGVRTNESFINIYELVNSHNAGASDYESNFGLYDWNWNAKPAATALHNFTSIIEADTGKTPGGSLDYSVTGGPSGAASVPGGDKLFADHAGHYNLVVWSEGTTYNEKISFATAQSGRVYDPMNGSSPIATFSGQTSVNVTVTDHPLIVQVDNAGASGGGSTGGGTTTPPPTTSAPAAPAALTLAAASDTGASATDHITKDNTPTITGTGVAGAQLTLYDGSTSVGTATVDSTGKWSVTTSTLADGAHSLTAKESNTGGTSAASTTLSVTVDTHAPNAPAAAHVTSTDPATSTPTVAGTAEAGSTVNLLDGSTNVGHAVADASGNWSITSSTLAAGAHSFTETATDAAGNQSAASTALAWTSTAAGSGGTTPPPTTTPTPGTGTGTPTAAVTQHDVWHYEGNGSSWFNASTDYSFEVSRTGDLSQSSSVDWTVAKAAGSAGNMVGGDFSASNAFPHGTATFAAGQSTATIHIAVNADNGAEQDETFSVNFSNYKNLTAGSMTATGHVLNDDGTGPFTALPSGGSSSGSAPPAGGGTTTPPIDPMDGSKGSMTITGTSGADTITGGNKDVLTGGGGADHFALHAGFGEVTITDFNHSAGDILDLYGEGEPSSIARLSNGVQINFDNGDHVILQGAKMSQIWSGSDWILH